MAAPSPCNPCLCRQHQRYRHAVSGICFRCEHLRRRSSYSPLPLPAALGNGFPGNTQCSARFCCFDHRQFAYHPRGSNKGRAGRQLSLNRLQVFDSPAHGLSAECSTKAERQFFEVKGFSHSNRQELASLGTSSRRPLDSGRFEVALSKWGV